MRTTDNALDREISALAQRLGSLPPQGQAAFFGCCADALSVLFDRFAVENRWAAPDALQPAIAVALAFAQGKPEKPDDDLLESLGGLIPHADDYETPQSTYAQDAVICADAAVRCASAEPVDPQWIEYAFEPLITSLSKRDLGLTQPGDREAGWRDAVVNVPEMARAVEGCRSAIRLLEGQEPVSAETLLEVRARVRALVPRDIPLW